MDNQTPQNPPLALAITKAIAYNENGGKPDITNPSAGKSGELKSIFQYTPDTWKAVAGKYLGNSNAPLTADNETVATSARVSDWLKAGYTPEQIFSMWNAGPGEPDAYSGKFSDGSSSSGTNKFGVKYNVSSYVDNGMKYLSEFEPELSQRVATVQNKTPTQPEQTQTASPAQNTQSAQSGGDPLSTILSTLQSKGGQSAPLANTSGQVPPEVPQPTSRQIQNPLRQKGLLTPTT